MKTFAVTGLIVVALAMAFACLAETSSRKQFLTIILVSIAVLVAFITIGAVFGKTLGDFLRNVNG